MLEIRRWLPCVLLLVGALGCGGSSGPERYTVTGTVQFDGKPVETGEIRLYPKVGEGNADAGKIENGKFSLEATAGEKRVEIDGYAPTGPVFDGQPGMEQFLPAKYNSASTLEKTVEGEKSAWKFDLEP